MFGGNVICILIGIESVSKNNANSQISGVSPEIALSTVWHTHAQRFIEFKLFPCFVWNKI